MRRSRIIPSKSYCLSGGSGPSRWVSPLTGSPDSWVAAGKSPRSTQRGLFERLASAEGLTERASTFGRAEVVKEIAGALPDGGTRTQIEHLAETFLRTRDIVPLLPTPTTEQAEELDPLVDASCDRAAALAGDEESRRMMRRRDGSLFPGVRHEHRYTTTELLVTEQRIIEQARAGIGAGRWAAPHRLVEARLRRHRHLTEGQREMVRRFATSTNTIDIGIGPAGTGKTAVMEVIGQLATITGTPILGGALAGRTAAGLETATGIPSTTLTRLIGESRQTAVSQPVRSWWSMRPGWSVPANSPPSPTSSSGLKGS